MYRQLASIDFSESRIDIFKVKTGPKKIVLSDYLSCIVKHILGRKADPLCRTSGCHGSMQYNGGITIVTFYTTNKQTTNK